MKSYIVKILLTQEWGNILYFTKSNYKVRKPNTTVLQVIKFLLEMPSKSCNTLRLSYFD